jgi:sec-independent protein translocase protein TatA
MRPWHIVVLLIVVLVLFGAPRLPELARSIGKSLNILKEETDNLRSTPSTDGNGGEGSSTGDAKGDSNGDATGDANGDSSSSRGDARGE